MRGQQLELMKTTTFNALTALEDPGLQLQILAPGDDDKLKGSLVEPPRYIVCANPECRNLVPFSSKFCPLCGEEQPPEGDEPNEKDDEDKDGIDNFFEKRHDFLNPRNPNDARGDQDNDTFLNVEEYRAGTALDDPASFPPLAENLRIVKTFRRVVPIGLKRISRNAADDPARWDISLLVQEPGRARPRTRIVRIGESVGGYTLESARFEPPANGEGEETPVAVIKSDETGDTYELRPDQTTYQKTLFGHFIFLNSRLVADFRRRRLMQIAKEEGGEIRLPHLATRTIQTYRVTKLAQEGDTPVAEVVRIESERTDPEKDAQPIVIKQFKPREDLVLQIQRSSGMGMDGGDMMGPGAMAEPGMEMMDPAMQNRGRGGFRQP
jgi:hypothetical protein